MDEIKRCTRCILPASLKALTFDEDGICNHCRKYEADFKEWDSIKERKEQEFKKFFLQQKNQAGLMMYWFLSAAAKTVHMLFIFAPEYMV
jgi:hypothetical protein